MKKIFFTIACFAVLSTLHAQILYGTTSTGGNGGGTISRLEPSTGTLTAAFTFETQDGANAWETSLVQATDGKLYGMTYSGGSNNNGTIFSYNPSTAAYTKLYDLDFFNGRQPFGSLIQASDNKLYGMTNNGGLNGRGVIFSFDPATAIYTKLADFGSTNGTFPYGSLLQASDGKLYGMTLNGGTYDEGVIFSYNIVSGVYTKLKDFDGTNGKNPAGDFIQASDGKLYAMTLNGGNNDLGIIFSFNPVTDVITKLKDFDNANGCNPFNSFIKATNGKFYATTSNGGSGNAGVIFSYNPATNVYTKLKDFDYTNGAHPQGNLTQAADGKLYGMTTAGGGYSRGVLFSYNISTAAYTKLKDFDANSGSYPYGSLTKAADDKLYGMTYAGGIGERGVVFSYIPATAVYTILRNFEVNNTGSLLYGSVVKDASGKLYGMTYGGGSNTYGVLFSFNQATSSYTKLLDFDRDNGADPYGSLTLSSDGRLYGMTFGGGVNGAGVIFSYNTATYAYTKLKDFDNTNGSNPYGNLLEATNSKLYGMTWVGGINGAGVIFSFDPVTAVYTKLMDFGDINGTYPEGSLMQAKDGKLYGVTYSGGANDLGVLFSYNLITGTYKKLKDFDYNSGFNPNGTLVQGKDGKLYGMTTYGGSNYDGALFSYDPSTTVYTKLKDFDYVNGANPSGSLMLGSDGKLYGMTAGGGMYNAGIAFSLNPVTAAFTKIQDFNDTNGKAPQYTFFTEIPPAVKLKLNNVSIQEGNSGQKSMTFNITLSQSAKQPVTVDYATQNSTAKAPSDFIAQTGTLTFPPGVKQKTVSVLINGDTQAENDEKFKVLLKNPSNAAIKDSIGVGTILNDDAGFAADVKITNSLTPSISVYPNPAKKIATVKYNALKSGVYILQIADATGKILLTRENVSFTGENTIQIDVSHFAQGMYVVSVTDKNSKQTVKLNKE